MKAREFWIDDILNVDRPNQKTAYIYFEDTEKFNGRAIHVREVLPDDSNEMFRDQEYHAERMIEFIDGNKQAVLSFTSGPQRQIAYRIDQLKFELERTKKALELAKQSMESLVFYEGNMAKVYCLKQIEQIEAIEKGES